MHPGHVHEIKDDGNFTYQCGHCGAMHSLHASHEGLQFHLVPGKPLEHRTARLPPCEKCGATTHLKVDFTNEELQAGNMVQWIDEDGNAIPGGRKTASHATAHRHMAVARHMERVGKMVPAAPPETPNLLDELMRRIEALEGKKTP